MQHRFVNARINSGTDASSSYTSLVKIGPVTSEFKKAKIASYVATRPQFDDSRSFGTLAFRNGLQYQNFDLSSLIGNHFVRTYCENLMRFGSLSQSFRRKNLCSRRRKFYWGDFSYVHEGAGLLGTAVISNWVYFISIRYGATLRRRAGSTLGFPTHF